MPETFVPNVLAERYASEAMCRIWSPAAKVIRERELWIAVMRAQQDVGIPIPPEAIAAYEAVKEQVDLDSIMARERITRHDVKARIDEFCGLAGHEQIHKGLTSRDLTENVEQLQVMEALRLTARKTAAALARLSLRAGEYADLVLTARTHNVPAQLTTFGKRLAMFGGELLGALEQLRHVIATYPARGLKGAVGTQLDQLSLVGGDPAKVTRLEERLLHHLGFPAALGAVGQVYPRSLDFRVVSVLTELGSAPSSLAKTLRLMAGHETAGEGFAPGQVGSSAMPHKMNSRSCERLNGLHLILKGHLTMASGLAGDQWNEGDVSCSVVRRVVLPDAFFALDGLLETFLVILGQMEAHPAAMERENQRYLPFLLSTTFLMEAVRRGVGRETAHEAIKEHAVTAAKALRDETHPESSLVSRLAADPRLALTREDLEECLRQGMTRTGAARDQVAAFQAAVRSILADFPGAESYCPGDIL
jgi:adenylosuccinate lyase